MQTPETRVIHQSTYTPIETERNDLRAQQPFLKKQLLLTVFTDAKRGSLVLEHMAQLQHGADHQPHPQFEPLSTAIKAAWTGDLAASATALRDVSMDEVVHFAREGLAVEKSLLDDARRAAQDAASAVTDRVRANAQVDAQVQRELATLREALAAEVQNIVAPLMAEHSRPVHESGGMTGARQAVTPQLTHAAVIQSPSARGTLPDATMPRTVTAEMLRAEIGTVAPRAAAFLDAVGAFPLVPVGNVALLPDIVNVHDAILAWKQRTLETLVQEIKVEPMGYLHLERLQFTPVGYERGELVYSLPMMPGETVRLTHREWSRTENEYSKLVATETERSTEEAISEKSELTQSSTTQQQHASAFSASVSAGYSGAGFNISTSFGYNVSDSESRSRQVSSKQAQDITKKASSRAKKDSKITFKVTTAYETEEQSFKEIKNELGRPVRYDFHRLMKKWRIDLYRYGVRMTYDIVIPEPGSYLLRKYIQLKQIEDDLSKPNPFNLSPVNIVREPKDGNQLTWAETIAGISTWVALAQKYGVSLDPPPEEHVWVTGRAEETYSDSSSDAWHDGFLELNLPDGYEFEPLTPVQTSPGVWMWQQKTMTWVISHDPDAGPTVGDIGDMWSDNPGRIKPGTNRFLWHYEYRFSRDVAKNGDKLTLVVSARGKLSDRAFREWQMECYEKLAGAARTQYENTQAELKQKRDALLLELNREDALMLRKIEKEELMKGVLRWLLGPDFDLYPKDVLGLPASLGLDKDGNLEFYDSTTKSVKTEYWKPTLLYGEMIKFLHQAIEWENVNYVLYPYFWTFPDENRWDFKQSLYHADYVHRSFLRAGAARVVLTIRPGFEKQFLSFMEGQLDTLLEGDHHYMTVADELKALAMTKYPYTQDANVEKEEYLFTWEDIGDHGAQNERLLYYVEKNLFVNWDYTFSVGLNFAGELDNGQISAALRDEFQKHKIALPAAALVQVNEPKRDWTISYGDTAYSVQGGDQDLHIYDWTDRPVPTKSADGNSIHIANGGEAIDITKDDEKGVAILKSNNGRTLDFVVKQEGNHHKLFKQQNWVDTWYEFTPTGALDVVEGQVL